jgi:superfamily I DNA and/or RNA helicase
LDEAGTVPEAKICIIVANLPHVSRIVSIGDQQQLEPYSDIRKSSSDEQTEGYFHRALRVLKTVVPMLRIQFRMHPNICSLVSDIGYKKLLITDSDVATKRRSQNSKPITWITYSNKNPNQQQQAGGCESKSKSSYVNKTEIKIVCDMAEKMLKSPQKFGASLLIITFYKEQLVALRKELAKRHVLKRDPITKEPVEPEDGALRVATVDSAQGSEADAVILSCVRSNHKKKVGFLTNQNRAIVALSRARRTLVIVGDKETVAHRKGPWKNALKSAVVESV